MIADGSILLAQTTPATSAAAGSLAGHFTYLDWIIVFGYLALTTTIGGMLAGKQSTIREFFLGGRKLPWYAVAGSIVATEISAVTFISVPYVVFRPSGDITYLQLGVFGGLLCRFIVGYILVPAYYAREIYSPYDYMGQKLGEGVRRMTTALFTLGGILAQSARVYLTAVVLELVLKEQLESLSGIVHISPLAIAIWIIGIVAIIWTIMGGITTVIWTDVILFLVFLLGAIVALCTVVYSTPGGWIDFFRESYNAGKFHFWDSSVDPTKAYTIWTAVIANTWFGVAIYGTDQLMAQRTFCCRDVRKARKAMIISWLGIIVPMTVMLVGAGLFVYYRYYPLVGESLAAYTEKPDRIFPIFILTVVPPGLTGLIIAAVFAAAISSLDSILAALAQTSISAFYLPFRKHQDGNSDAEARRTVIVSRVLVVVWGILLCIMAQLVEVAARHYTSILDLALAMAGYTAGALLAGFLLAFLPLKLNGRGYLFAAPLSVLTVFAVVWHDPWSHNVCMIAGTVLLVAWLAANGENLFSSLGVRQSIYLLLGVAMMIAINYFGYFDVDGAKVSIAWPWQAPIGSAVALIWGYFLAS